MIVYKKELEGGYSITAIVPLPEELKDAIESKVYDPNTAEIIRANLGQSFNAYLAREAQHAQMFGID